ncbi:MAG TPA: DUF1700 domain-containing protein [Vicinamibacterales bacterium]|nr:DUF1700 domain-containing protein [Vicinamibacterales bacterium]
MTDAHPLIERYLTRLDAGLKDLPAAERSEVLGEIRNHIAEAAASGKPIDAVLSSLGSADDLARGYAIELLLNPPPAGQPAERRTGRFLKLAGLIAVGSLPTFIVVVVLGSIGVSFTAAGIVVFLAGILAAFGALPNYVTMDTAPWVAVLIGPAVAILGALALVLLVWYVKFTARLVRRVVPRLAPAGASR